MKAIVIDSCKNCVWIAVNRINGKDTKPYCLKLSEPVRRPKPIRDINKIPRNCPLDDYKVNID